jgi:hypothetical protein
MLTTGFADRLGRNRIKLQGPIRKSKSKNFLAGEMSLTLAATTQSMRLPSAIATLSRNESITE